MNEIFFLVEIAPEGGYTAQALGYPLFTEAETWEELKAQAQDAVRCHFETDAPRLIRLHLVQEEVVVCASPAM